MARKRMISPDIHTDAKYIQLSYEGRLLFTGMFNFADDEGIFENNPLEMKCKVFPADSITLELIKNCINSMIELTLLEKGENKLLRYKNWHNYQKISHPSPTKYIFKLASREDSVNPPEDSVSPPLALSEDSERTPSQYSIDSIDKSSLNSVDKNNKEVKENSSKKTKTQLLKEEFTFDRFYELYPRKIKKDKAFNPFKNIAAKHLKAVFDGLNAYIVYWRDAEVDLAHIPYPATWLNAKQWNDDIPIVKPKGPKFVNDLDKEIHDRNSNLVKQSERMRTYLKEAGDNAIDEVPDLLTDFKKSVKESNAQPISEAIGSYMAQAEPDTSTDG